MPVISTTLAIATAVGGALVGSAGIAGLSTAVGLGVMGAAGYGAVKGIGALVGSGDEGSSAGSVTTPDTSTGSLDGETASEIARKKLFRSGTVFTAASGLFGDSGNTSQARLK